MPSFVITGGPGSGKTTLLNALSEKGYQTVSEVSRTLIQQQVLAGTQNLPWIDLPCFAKLCLEKMAADFGAVEHAGSVFFDRGIPDILAYLKVGGHLIDADFDAAAKQNRYETKVFIAPPWEEIYVNDDERWQTFSESCDLYKAIRKIYVEEGYQLIELPLLPVEKRVEFLISQIVK